MSSGRASNGDDPGLGLLNPTSELGLEILVRKIRGIIEDTSTLRQALYYRLLRIVQYLAWKFPSYGAIQLLLEDLSKLSKTKGAGGIA